MVDRVSCPRMGETAITVESQITFSLCAEGEKLKPVKQQPHWQQLKNDMYQQTQMNQHL